MDFMDLLYEIMMSLIMIYRIFRGVIVRLLLGPWKRLVVWKLNEIGVTINGKEPHDIQVHSDEFYYRIFQDQSLGLGESYMEGLWDAEHLDEHFTKVILGNYYRFSMLVPDVRFLEYLKCHVFNMQTAQRSWEVAVKHYDLGNKLYESFLDETMTYTCGYWKDAKTLTESQKAKMDLVGRKLQLKPGMRVLELGCGWGGLCKYLAEKYQVHMTGVTISKEGAKYGQELCKGLSVDISCRDYRDVTGEFDRVVAVGILEHVGRKNYRGFFELAHNCLPEHGIFLCHSIGLDTDDFPSTEPWLNKYIFPHGMIPDHRNITESIHNLFTIEDWHNFGADYDKTLMAWYQNFNASFPKISHLFADPTRFYRMWKFYLLLCAAAFRTRKYQLWQIVLSKHGVIGGYDSVR